MDYSLQRSRDIRLYCWRGCPWAGLVACSCIDTRSRRNHLGRLEKQSGEDTCNHVVVLEAEGDVADGAVTVVTR